MQVAGVRHYLIHHCDAHLCISVILALLSAMSLHKDESDLDHTGSPIISINVAIRKNTSSLS